MGFHCMSENYIWSSFSFLGKGASASVYKGFNKKSGEAVAVKTFYFNQSVGIGSDEHNREFEILGKLNHENIVKLLAVEKEEKNQCRIIVMELCTGGSLLKILSEPENAYGFAEAEFLLVLKHTSDGMKYLHDLNIVHRDLKPGNIMKYITSDGKSVYKLTDFGAARELEEGQQFESIHGTIEYLHPDLYERAVLRKDVSKSFGAGVDLWSMGVTLYHIAAGALPFRPYGGRITQHTLFIITTQKKSGVISGVENSAGGPIEYSDQLPPTCQLSLGLRKFITPILAGLMEYNENKMWTFDRFFSEVTSLLEKIRYILFFVDQCQLLTLYVDPNDTLDKFRSLIQEQTNILPEKQHLYFKNKIFEDVVDAKMVVSNYPQTSLDLPLFLLGNVLPIVIKHTNRENCESIYFPRIAASVVINKDIYIAKIILNNGYYVKRCIENTTLIFYLLQDFAQTMNAVVKNKFIKSKLAIDQAGAKTRSIIEKLNLLQSHHKTISTLLDLFENSNPSMNDRRTRLSEFVEIKQESCTIINKQFHDVQNRLMSVYQKVVEEDFLWNQWKKLHSFKNDLKKCLACANTYVRGLQTGRRKFDKLRNQRDTSNLLNDSLYLFEKMRIDDVRSKLCRVYHNDSLPALKNSVEDISQWLSLVHQISVNTTDDDLFKAVDELDIALSKAHETYDEIVNDEITKSLSKCYRRNFRNEIIPSRNRIKLAKIIKEAKACVNDETPKIIDMNQVLNSKLNAAAISLNSTIEKFNLNLTNRKDFTF